MTNVQIIEIPQLFKVLEDYIILWSNVSVKYINTIKAVIKKAVTPTDSKESLTPNSNTNSNKRILIACEESQAVTKEFRKLGFQAYSCDILDCSGGHPEWHIKGDILHLLNQKWDAIIAFPPCTYLTNAGTRHFSRRVNPEHKVLQREKLRLEAFDFFMKIANSNCEKIAIENPVGFVNSQWRKPDQIIHPYFFGDNFKKRTCLWLKGLPTLELTNKLPEPDPMYICQGKLTKGKKIGWCEGINGVKGGQAARAKARSKTFPGIAKAMAEQWSIYV